MLDINSLLGFQQKTPQRSMIRLQASVSCSPNTTRTWTNIIERVGNDIQYQKDTVTGDRLVAVTGGLYLIQYTDSFGAASYMGITLNSTTLATNIISMAQKEILTAIYQPSADTPASVFTPVVLNAGDIIRVQGGTIGAGANAPGSTFTMCKVSGT